MEYSLIILLNLILFNKLYFNNIDSPTMMSDQEKIIINNQETVTNSL